MAPPILHWSQVDDKDYPQYFERGWVPHSFHCCIQSQAVSTLPLELGCEEPHARAREAPYPGSATAE